MCDINKTVNTPNNRKARDKEEERAGRGGIIIWRISQKFNTSEIWG